MLIYISLTLMLRNSDKWPQFKIWSLTLYWQLETHALLCVTVDVWEVKTAGTYSRKKVLLMTHLPISPILNAAVKMTLSRNSGWSRWLIFWLWHRSQKQKAPFPQGGTTVNHQNPTPNHSKNVTKAQEVNLVTHLVMSPGSFNVNFLFIYDSSTWPLS